MSKITYNPAILQGTQNDIYDFPIFHLIIVTTILKVISVVNLGKDNLRSFMGSFSPILICKHYTDVILGVTVFYLCSHFHHPDVLIPYIHLYSL